MCICVEIHEHLLDISKNFTAQLITRRGMKEQ
jgi:hypothetical protein